VPGQRPGHFPAEVAVVPGSHGGSNRINALNDRIAAFIKAHAAGKQTPQTDTGAGL
jgi:hypothetical protein